MMKLSPGPRKETRRPKRKTDASFVFFEDFEPSQKNAEKDDQKK